MNIKKTIENYNDIELAFFAKYRLNTYMPETQTIIKNEVKKRNFDIDKINRIVENIEFNSRIELGKNQCPRCFSKRLFPIEEEKFNETKSSAIDPNSYRTDVKKEKVLICQICGFNLKHGAKPSFISRLIKKIKKNTIANKV